MLRRVPRPTFGPLAGRRSRAQARHAAPAALARLGGPAAAGWRLGEPFDGRGDTNVFAVQADGGSPALLKATDSTQGRLQLERQVRVLAALHADPRLGPWVRLVPRTLSVGDVDGLHFVLESRLPGADCRRLPEAERCRVIPMALETIGELSARSLTGRTRRRRRRGRRRAGGRRGRGCGTSTSRTRRAGSLAVGSSEINYPVNDACRATSPNKLRRLSNSQDRERARDPVYPRQPASR